MYPIQNLGHLLKTRRFLRRHLAQISRNVLFLGLTSLVTDISSEMISTILPLYLVFTLHLAPLQFGIVDGLYQGAAALMRIASGLVADRWRRYKEVAALGYALSAICKIGLLAAGSAWTLLAAIVLIDRTGKGIRTAPRDALISLSVPQDQLATAFGVHRALDTAGAMIGPLVAFGLLALTPGAFDAIFVVSFCVALIGLGILMLFVENRRVADAKEDDNTKDSADSNVSLKATAELLRIPRFRALVLVGTALSLATLSDGFIYLGLQRALNLNLSLFPLLYVATSLVYMLLAVPIGRLADQVGRGRVFTGGYGLLAVIYTLLLVPGSGMLGAAVTLLLLGVYYAATDGVLMALASTQLPKDLRTSGLALLTTATSLSRLLSSALFGILWTWRGIETAVLIFLLAIAIAIPITAVVLIRTYRSTIRE